MKTALLLCALHQEETASPVGSDKVAEEEGEDLDFEEYDEEEEEDDDDRPRKKPKHGGFILDEAGTSSLVSLWMDEKVHHSASIWLVSSLCLL